VDEVEEDHDRLREARGVKELGSLLILAALAAAAIHVLRRRPAFVIRIRDGEPRARKGRVPQPFLDDCRDIAAASGLRRATIRGFQSRGRVALGFSRQVGEDERQRFRNVWNLRR
jgi:hypothetical protein